MRKILENIENLQAQDFMEKQLYEELFSVKSKIDRSEIKFKLMDRAKSVKAKHIAEEFIKEFQKAEQEKEKKKKQIVLCSWLKTSQISILILLIRNILIWLVAAG